MENFKTVGVHFNAIEFTYWQLKLFPMHFFCASFFDNNLIAKVSLPEL